MTELLYDKRPIVSDEQLSGWVKNAKNGCDISTEQLATHLNHRLQRYYLKRLPTSTPGLWQTAEDLTQITVAEVFRSLPRFDPALGRGTEAENFLAWQYAIARSKLNCELRTILKASKEKPLSNEASDLDGDFVPVLHEADIMERYKNRLSEVLTARQLEVVWPLVQGESYDEVAEELGINRRAAIGRVVNARPAIEKYILQPNGFVRIKGPEDDSLIKAIMQGRAVGVKILGIWYTTKEWENNYKAKARVVDPEMLEDGYVLLSENTTISEYSTLKGSRYGKLIKRQKGLIYIKREDLFAFRQTLEKRQRRIDPPGPEYKLLADFANNWAEYARLRRAIQKGDLRAIKKGSWWFVTPKDYTDYCES